MISFHRNLEKLGGAARYLRGAEDNVIGMSLNDRANFTRAWGLGVRWHDFAEPTNRILWRALCHKSVDSLEAAYPALIERLREECPLTQNVEFYAAPLVVARLDRRFRAEMAGAMKNFPADTRTIAQLMVNFEEQMAKLKKWEGYLGEGVEGGTVSRPRKHNKPKREIQSRESRRRDIQADFDNFRQ